MNEHMSIQMIVFRYSLWQITQLKCNSLDHLEDQEDLEEIPVEVEAFDEQFGIEVFWVSIVYFVLNLCLI